MSRRALLAAAAIVLVVSAPLAVNRHLHLRADAMSNTALAHAVRRHGLPPRDPYLAGQPLHYHWAYNAAVAGLSALTGLEPYTLAGPLPHVGSTVRRIGSPGLPDVLHTSAPR